MYILGCDPTYVRTHNQVLGWVYHTHTRHSLWDEALNPSTHSRPLCTPTHSNPPTSLSLAHIAVLSMSLRCQHRSLSPVHITMTITPAGGEGDKARAQRAALGETLPPIRTCVLCRSIRWGCPAYTTQSDTTRRRQTVYLTAATRSQN